MSPFHGAPSPERFPAVTVPDGSPSGYYCPVCSDTVAAHHDMTVKEIFDLRKLGHIEEAYEAAREIYARDKSPIASSAMFWTAVDILQSRVNQDRVEEAKKIFMALERLLDSVTDENGYMHATMENCRRLMERGEARTKQLEEGPIHMKMGVWGEELAVRYLLEKSYVILEHDWHSTHRDIDIIARQDDCLVFVEVKTRRNTTFTQPIQAVDYKKQRNLKLAINHYLNYRKWDGPIRFDVITVVGELGTPNPEIEHIEDIHLSVR